MLFPGRLKKSLSLSLSAINHQALKIFEPWYWYTLTSKSIMVPGEGIVRPMKISRRFMYIYKAYR